MTSKYIDIDREKSIIVSAVYERLRQWGKNFLLPREKVAITQECFAAFYKRIGKKGLVKKIYGWDCALGQIINIDDPRMFKALPYMLTAYMYNFGEDYGLRGEVGKNTRFVKRYTESLPSSPKFDYKNPKFFGLEVLSDEQGEQPGIGKLLSGRLDVNSTKVRSQLKILANNFVFPQTIKKSLSDGDYIIPNTTRNVIDFDAHCESLHIKTRQGFEYRESIYAAGSGDREYYSACFRWVFLTWYSIWRKFAKNENYELDPLLCNSLMLDALCIDKSKSQKNATAGEIDAEFLKTYKKGDGEYRGGGIWCIVD